MVKREKMSPLKAGDPGPEAPPVSYKAGDVVELRSGSFPMTVMAVHLSDGSLCLTWDQYGPHSGRASRLSRTNLPAAACMPFVPYSERDGGGDIPF